MKKIIVSGILSLVIFSSCKKDKEECENTVAKIAGTYKLVAATYTAPGLPSQNIYATLDACEKDDIQILNTNGTFTYQDAGTVCSPDGSYAGTWSVSGNTITIDGETATIESFDCNKLVAYISGGLIAGDRLTTTLQKQ